MKKMKIKMWDDMGVPIASAKGSIDELSKKTKSWLEKFK